MVSSVPQPLMMICSRSVEVSVVDENMSAGQQIDEPEDVGVLSADNSGGLLQRTAAPKQIRRRPILSAIGRRFSVL